MTFKISYSRIHTASFELKYLCLKIGLVGKVKIMKVYMPSKMLR